MNLNKLGAIMIMLGLIVGFLVLMPVLISSSSEAAADATLTGDTATASTLSILPLISAVAGIGVSLLFVVSVLRR